MKNSTIVLFILLILLLLLTLIGCSSSSTADAKGTRSVERVTFSVIDLEDLDYDAEGFVVDKRSGCLYKYERGQYESLLAPIYGTDKQVVGCNDFTHKEVESYLRGQ